MASKDRLVNVTCVMTEGFRIAMLADMKRKHYQNVSEYIRCSVRRMMRSKNGDAKK